MSSNHSLAAYLRYLLQWSLLAGLYFAFGYISFLTTVSNHVVTPVFFMAEGIALAAAIRWGAQVWPGIFLGQLALALTTDLGFLPSFLVAATNSIEAIIGVSLFRRWNIDPHLDSVRDFSRLLVMIFLILQPFSATLGTATLWFFEAIQKSADLFQAWSFWWIGNCMGQFLITPVLLIIATQSRRLEFIQRSIRAAILPMALILPVTWIVFGNTVFGSVSLALVMYVPLLIWIAIKSGLATVSVVCSGITWLALHDTAHGYGPFVVDQSPNIFDMNIFIVGISLTAQFVSVLFTENTKVTLELQESRTKLYAMINSSPIPKAICDDRTVLLVNKSFTRLLGYTLEDIPTLSAWGQQAFPDAAYRQWVTSTWAHRQQTALQGNTDFEPLDITVQGKNGALCTMVATASLFKSNAAGKQYLIDLIDITACKNLENQLVRNHEFLEDLSNSIPGFIYQFQRFPDGHSCIPFASKGIQKLMGISPEAVIENVAPITAIIHPEDANKLGRSIRKSAESLNDWYFEFRIIVRPGEIRWIHAQSKPEKQSDGSIVWNGYATDITELKNASLRFEALLDSASDGIHILDEDGNVVHFSRSFAKMLGYTYEETARLNVMDWDAKIPKDKLIGTAREILRSPRVFETLHQRSDGTIFDVEINARGIEISGKKFIYASSRDITSRKSHQKELEYQRMRLSNIIEGTHIGTWEWNVQTGEVIFNERWAQIIGYRLDELAPISIETWLTYAHPDDLHKSEVLLKAHFAGKLSYYEVEARMRHKHGHWIWVLDRGKVLSWTDDGKPLMMFGTHQDITDLKEREALLIEARQQAEAANIAKTRFLAMMSHEIRTPMNAVSGMVYLLSKTDLDSRQNMYLRNIEGSSNILLGVINDILDYSKIEANKVELDHVHFDLNNVLENLAAMASTAALDKAIDVLFYVEPAVPRYFVGDPIRLSQIFVNLTNNAIKFTDRGEVIIRISAEATDQPGIIMLAFSVADSGIGIRAEQLSTLFQAFSQADTTITRRFGGTGLGLSISKRLAQQMHGTITVDSEYGRGSRFHATVRLQQSEEAAASWMKIPESLHSLNVMIVDDHAATRQVVLEIVQSLGWKTVTAISGTHAIKQLAAFKASPFDLLLITIRKHDPDPFQVLHDIETALPTERQPKILLITGTMDAMFSKNIERNSLIGAIIRPFTAVGLTEAVVALFDKKIAKEVNRTQMGNDAHQQFSNAHVVVAEDNEFNQLLMSELLGNWGIGVSLVQNGAECIDLLKAADHPYDLIFMDIQMPVMDGMEATRYIRQDMQLTTPIVALTANVMESDQQGFILAGMDAFLPKPFDPEELHQILLRFINPS
ncbi:PAS domain S-box protein [Nitrosomonas sp. JL21]|uniref:PAS domain S-box protein n=1 Tax=Nitrosomonas sp. JL21 TaxID=153949 RepID=UPI0013711EB7|nr:PAS domain S-box protein [Nitrosomonas sp. JL21]MBL8498096.1 PAS domain S-box protein [Nitrosomonas sp.]MXS76390.1 PAS domain S-box protein [Nitrosomonas sp. JL21]